jgi:phage repressor protein C with HTH and peptisase S24 domain
MQLDPVRLKVLQLIQKSGKDMKAASLAIGKNAAYLQQFLFRGTPRSLSDDTREALAQFLGVEESELEHSFALPREARKRPSPVRVEKSGDELVSVPVVEVSASAGGGALNEEAPDVIGHWRLPRSLLERELKVHEHSVQLVSILGDSMSPTLSDGDKVLVDLAHKRPSPPGIYVLWDGTGLVAKRIEVVPGESPRVRLHSDNPLYSAYECHPDEVRISGRVVWAAKRL